ncbi:MAG: ABC transporter permease [Acidimicrobiales bacterium]
MRIDVASRWAAVLRSSRALVLVIAGLLLAWEAVAVAMRAADVALAASKLAAPHEIAVRIVGESSLLASNLRVTALGALAGLVGGVAIGVGVALLVAQARWLEGAVYPYIIAGQMIPTIALAPLILVATRNQTVTRFLVATSITFFAISLATLKGLKSTSPAALELMRSYSASRLEVYTRVRIPAALPFFFAGLKVAAPLAVVGEIVVELTGANSGLGYTILVSQYYGPTYASLFWAAMVVTLLLGVVFYMAAVGLERLVTPWQSEFRAD